MQKRNGPEAGMRDSSLAHADTGCQHFGSCLECPLPRCLFEVSGPEKVRMMRDYRWSRIAEAFREMTEGGAPADRAAIEVAAWAGCAKRTVYRAVSDAAKGGQF